MDIVQILVQGGSVGVAIAALGIIYKFLTNHSEHSNQVIQKNTEAHVTGAVVQQKLISTLESLEKAVQSRLK